MYETESSGALTITTVSALRSSAVACLCGHTGELKGGIRAGGFAVMLISFPSEALLDKLIICTVFAGLCKLSATTHKLGAF